MGVRYPSVASNVLANALPANATETVICVTPPLNVTLDFAQVFLQWMFTLTVGASCTSLIMRIRRGITTGGVTINPTTWNFTTVAGNFALISGCYFDTPGPVAGQQYALTVSQTAASAAGVPIDQAMLAFSF